jgi:hypothetical protein
MGSWEDFSYSEPRVDAVNDCVALPLHYHASFLPMGRNRKKTSSARSKPTVSPNGPRIPRKPSLLRPRDVSEDQWRAFLHALRNDLFGIRCGVSSLKEFRSDESLFDKIHQVLTDQVEDLVTLVRSVDPGAAKTLTKSTGKS